MGRIDSPITAPGKLVELELVPACDGASPGFDVGTPANNVVTITFEPPGAGAPTPVIASPVEVVDTLRLRFTMPDTSGALAPHGLAGPATIRVEHAGTTDLLAEIGPLFQPTSGCDKQPETTFQQFTTLPPANVVADLVDGSATQILATLDGGDNLLVPMNWLEVLPLGAAAPVARFLEGQSGIEAFQGGGQPIVVPDETFVRAFTLDGRPLPPLLRVSDSGEELYGTADAEESVLRIARNDGSGGGDIYDFTTRLFMDRGPIVIDKTTDGFTVVEREAIPLEGLQSSAEAIAFARPESLEGDLNGDFDSTDAVVQIVNVATGAGTNTQKAVVSIPTDDFLAPEIVTDGDIVAFLESEADQGVDYTLDGDFDDSIVRVYSADGVELSAGFDFEAIPKRRVSGRTLAVSEGLVVFRTPEDLPGFVETLDLQPFNFESNDIALSPDGRHMYAAGLASDSVILIDRDVATGELSVVTAYQNGSGGIDGVIDATGVVVSNDGLRVYVAGETATDPAVTTFDRDPVTGALTFVEADVTLGLSGSRLAISPDDAHVYVASNGAVGVYEVVAGGLDAVEADGAAGGGGIAVSADGAHVYLSSFTDRVFVMSRDSGTGEVSFVEQEEDGVNGVDGINGAFAIVVSPDGGHVYVAGRDDDAVAAFTRDTITGELTFLEVHRQGVGGVDGLTRVEGIGISADGSQVYAVGGSSGGSGDHLVVFERDGGTGSLTFADFQGTNCAPNQTVITSSDSESVYVGCYVGFVTHLERPRGRVRVFDTAGMALTPVDAMATIVEVAGQDVSVLNDEGAAGLCPYLFNGLTGSTSGTVNCSTEIAVSDVLMAGINEESFFGDLNSDGDFGDTLLQTLELRVGPRQEPGLTVDTLDVSGPHVVLISPEFMSSEDLNGDLDQLDRVIRIFDGVAVSTTEVGQAAEEFVLKGDLFAFRTSEAAQGNTDLNGDGDTLDAVMRVYRLSTDTLFEVGQAASICDIPGCDPFLPYKVDGDSVSFITREPEQGNTDLNGDGDALDIVMQVFNTVSGTLQVFDLGDECQGSTTVTRFPETFVDEAVLFVEQSEVELGVDLNGDGDALDCVTLVTGDQDGDGAFNDFDTCVEDPNPEQRDPDADDLGAICDPAFSCTAAPKGACRVPTVDFKSLLVLKDKTPDTKDLIVWKWLKGAETTFADFGDPVSVDDYTLCIYDESGGASMVTLAAAAPVGGVCATKPCWKSKGDKGYLYKDAERTPDGLLKVLLKSGVDGKAKVVVKGKGENLPPFPSLPAGLPLRVQLQATTGQCWESGFGAAGALVNRADLFKGKANVIPPPPTSTSTTSSSTTSSSTTSSTSSTSTTSTSSTTTTTTLPGCFVEFDPCAGSCPTPFCLAIAEGPLVCVDVTVLGPSCVASAECNAGEVCVGVCVPTCP